ncbi:MAG TPA: polysaccharide pyruvyl transferase family protein, partial [Flavobacteriaceae bacterium]|nr:polysaccharide pyruvyl transferase family protein [Flavobacteriaceae bacterium]
KFILKTTEENFDKISHNDTHINKNNLSLKQRTEELNKIWTAFRSAELVITDRLHGMIFCYITGTPCVVFQNNNHKVRETYDWIKSNTNVKLMKDFSEPEIKTALEAKRQPQPVGEDLLRKYEELVEIVTGR